LGILKGDEVAAVVYYHAVPVDERLLFEFFDLRLVTCENDEERQLQ
jgi:hypothetical protein